LLSSYDGFSTHALVILSFKNYADFRNFNNEQKRYVPPGNKLLLSRLPGKMNPGHPILLTRTGIQDKDIIIYNLHCLHKQFIYSS